MSTRFGVFAKHWTPGLVKTRLAASIGDEQAAQLHRAFLETLLQRFQNAADSRWLYYSPPDQGAAFETLALETVGANQWRTRPQCDGDLGQRMEDYFETGQREGDSRICLIGSDSPNLPREYVEDAFAQLESTSVVLGPSRDGGYYLIAAKDKAPPVFRDILWGGDTVLSTTLELLQREGVAYSLLPTWYDVDVLDDVGQLASDLNADDLNASDLNADERVADERDAAGLDEPLRRLRTLVNKLVSQLVDNGPSDNGPSESGSHQHEQAEDRPKRGRAAQDHIDATRETNGGTAE